MLNDVLETLFWTAFLGTVIYSVSMWTAGITQGLMWRAVDSAGHLVYPDFVETVIKIVPLYYVRAVGGALYLVSFLLMFYNIAKTIANAPKQVTADVVSAYRMTPTTLSNLGGSAHRMLEGLPTVFSVLTLVAVGVGTFIELVPTFLAGDYVTAAPNVKPYTGLQLHGRDIYVREGCYLCHSQMVRPIVSETLRYGDYSREQESMYDHPFQWGSRRIGPDLAREGGRYPDLWHYRHMMDPREVTPGSIMPAYPWLFHDKTEFKIISKKLKVMRAVGVPYTDTDVAQAESVARLEAKEIASGLMAQGAPANLEDKEIVALIAYLQRLGSDHKKGFIK